MCGFLAQLVEHRTSIAHVTGSNSVVALIFFFKLILSNCFSWKIYWDDHSSLSGIIKLKKERTITEGDSGSDQGGQAHGGTILSVAQ